jgi:hypothetical protein
MTPDDDTPAATVRRETLPPDPAAYDHPRAEIARRKGLEAPYIAGGHDPEPEAARREERRLLRLLLMTVVLVILSGFVLGALSMLISGPR